MFNCHIKKEFIYNTKIQNKKKTPTTHSSNKVVEDSIKCLKMHFLSFYFQYLKCAFERPLLICIHRNHIIVLNKNSYSKFKSNWISQVSNLKVLTKLQKVHLSHFPSSHNADFFGVYLLKLKRPIFKHYVHLKFLVVVCILKETASLWLASRSGGNA